MPPAKLTKTYVDKLVAGPKDIIHWDAELRGFGVKVTPKGKKVYLVQYRPNGAMGNPRKFTIGPHGEWTLDGARRKAQEIIAAKGKGEDPQDQKRTAKKRLSSDRFDDLVEKHIAQHVAQFRQPRERNRLLRREFATKWGSQSVHEISKRDVRDVVESIYDRGASRVANMALVAIKVFFRWCVDQGILDTSPCADMRSLAKEKSRDRILSDDELRSVLLASRRIGHPFGSMVEALALTAQRKGEVARMTWQQVRIDDLEWHLPAEHSKNGKPHLVHLSPEMVALLKRTPRLEGPVVFSTDGRAPYQGFSKAKERLDRLSGVTDWTLHDLRRTAVSGMARLGVPHHVADKILNHQSGAIAGVARVYQRHDFLQERKRALEVWGAHVRSLAQEAETSTTLVEDEPGHGLEGRDLPLGSNWLEFEVDNALKAEGGRPQSERTQRTHNEIAKKMAEGASRSSAVRQTKEELKIHTAQDILRRQSQQVERRDLTDKLAAAVLADSEASVITHALARSGFG